jgi:hypothetical protein
VSKKRYVVELTEVERADLAELVDREKVAALRRRSDEATTRPSAAEG